MKREMKAPARLRCCCLGVLFGLGLCAASLATEVLVGDAYARQSADGQSWAIGTSAIEQVFDSKGGQFRLNSYKNKLTNPAREYVSDETAGATFALDSEPFTGRFAFEPIWSKTLPAQAAAAPAEDQISLKVEAGDLIGFSALSLGDASGANIEWLNQVAYQDGKTYLSSDDQALNQGPIWFYYLQATGNGCLDQMDETVESNPAAGVPEKVRVPVGYRAPLEAPTLNATHYSLKNAYTVLRAWKAPTNGTVTISGTPKLLAGSGAKLGIIRIKERGEAIGRLPQDFNQWAVEQGEASRVNAGGRPAVQLEFTLKRETLRVHLRVVAYPGTPILRQWVTFENTGTGPITLKAPASLTLSLRGDDATTFSNLWMCGGTSRTNAGVLRSAPVQEQYHHALLGEKTDNYVSWRALQRKKDPGDGWFVALDYLGTWTMSLDHDPQGPAILGVSLPSLAHHTLAAGERLEMPVVTLGTFQKNLDDMSARVYRWQYEYMWDYTNPEFYARPMWIVPWFACSRNLQEQFTARLANLDMDADFTRTIGFDMLWDDAGWSKYPGWPIPDNYGSVFSPTYEGPDFAQTLRYYKKMDLKWILWFAGRPSDGLMDTKVGSWGDFQFRTDGVGRFDLPADQAYRNRIKNFLTRNPHSSYHTCDGGSRFAHQFEIQRLGDVNYLSDLGRGPEANYYLSHLETPDKWVDVLESLHNGLRYDPKTSRHQLSMVPCWYVQLADEDREPMRRDVELYHYLLREGVAGRWSYLFHPGVSGDAEFYYLQRTSYDRKKACIILKHQAKGEVTIRPVELQPEHEYVVGFDSTKKTIKRTGKDLMQTGIVIQDQKPGELIFLGLPGRPQGGNDKTPPTAPGRVLSRREVNLGYSGVSVFWSPGTDDNWISGYTVRRDDKVLGRVSTGHYYFDHSPGWNPQAKYSVQTIDGDDNVSGWTVAQTLPNEPLTFSALGGHFAEDGREGWSTETTTDGKTFSPMTWVPPAKSPAGDLGGTPNQPGGVEGYWEGAGGARVGRGWQQASASTLCVRTWRAANTGRLRVVGRAFKDAYRQTLGQGLRVRILHGTRQVWPAQGWASAPLQDLVGAIHDLTLDVNQGDLLRFVLDRSDQPEHAILAWMPRLVYQEESQAVVGGSVVRIWCGSNHDYVDQSGQRWTADRYFHGGKAYSTQASIANATPTLADQALYQAGRRGTDFSYSIPVKPGLYAVRLKLAEPEHEWFFQRPFNLTINNAPVLHNYDVGWISRGPRQAHEQVLRYLVPNQKGRLELHFTAGWEPVAGARGEALVQAIEVLPEGGPERAVRINVGASEEFVDWNGFIWSADQADQDGRVLKAGDEVAVAQASPTLYDQALYRIARTGRVLRYRVAVTPGLHTVRLKFAELWLAAPGQRPMDIAINGRVWWAGWDPAVAAGQAGMAAELRAELVSPNGAGQIEVELRATGDHEAILQGLEIE